MRYTTYHCGKAVIKDKNKLSEAMEKLAKLEDEEGSSGWIPCSERLPKDGDCRVYMCLVENHIEDFPIMCQFEEENGFGFYKDIYDPISLEFLGTEFDTMEELGYEKVMYWMPLTEPFREVTDEENLESRR